MRHGFGLRREHFAQALAGGLGAELIEVLTENVLGLGGRPRRAVEEARRDCPVVLHGVSMSLGGDAPLDVAFLRRVRALKEELGALWVSDHASFGGLGAYSGHDLWPLPLTEEAVAHLAGRVAQAQDVLGAQLLVENVSAYLQLGPVELTEAEFLCELVARSGCALLLDLNNVVVNAHNFGFDAQAFVRALPSTAIRQLHLAGHADRGAFRFDDHGDVVSEEVWRLYETCVAAHGEVPSIIEWDTAVPALEVLQAQAARARTLASQARRAA